MCQFKSGVILKNKVVLAPEGDESHSNLLDSLNIEDSYINAIKAFVRAELIPPGNNKAADIDKWEYKVDQDDVPDWYKEDPERYEQEFRNEVAEYLKEKLTVFCGYAWTPIKTDEKGTYYLMDGYLKESEFGRNNNYAESYIRDYLNESDLVADLKAEFEDGLVPITTDLLSLDGLDDYGTVDGDILAIPTIDLYRECRKNIPNIDTWWWLATPDSTPSSCSSVFVLCVNSIGSVGCNWFNFDGAVRPFFILKS